MPFYNLTNYVPLNFKKYESPPFSVFIFWLAIQNTAHCIAHLKIMFYCVLMSSLMEESSHTVGMWIIIGLFSQKDEYGGVNKFHAIITDIIQKNITKQSNCVL